MGSIDYWPSVVMCFVAVGLLERTEKMQNVKINNYSYTKRGKKKNSSLYEGCKLFLSEDEFEVINIDCIIASILPFRIDIPPFSKSIQFGAKIIRIKPDNKVKLREILGPLQVNILVVEKYSRFL